ncbi:DUF6702 family protein [Pseudoduganella plicata]|uniref:DUF1007 family protein n=1 Tax=Pseudoduganella plicata TaxID=321984 RepID=A0A4P7BD69_9BURK|nr:DUF6702 family protein [Pseudoduganella plicata]QBQ36621.1 hypothetical protein E1742_10940 [Pseudoduganella plicata]GGY73933.1 hypothetical protein GCM10007388_02810 [Pseudoduganella plicata]
MRLRSNSILLALALYAGTAHAHNYHMGMADIGYNAATGHTEVIHTYTAHDIEALLANLYGRHFDLGLEEDQDVLRQYIEQRFTISAAGKRLPLQWVGVKADADTITVFQQIGHTALPPGAVIADSVLTDFIPTQINTVNVGANAGRAATTLTFTAASPQHALP